MKYISPLLLLRYCKQPDHELSSLTLNVARRQLQMKFDFDRIESIEIDGVTYGKTDVQAILQTITYSRDITGHQWVHKIPALLSFLTGKSNNTGKLNLPAELANSRDLDSFKRFISPFLFPAVKNFYDQIINTRNYQTAVLVNELSELVDTQNLDRYLSCIRSHLNALLTNTDADLASFKSGNAAFTAFIDTIPIQLKTERESLASRLRMTSVTSEAKPKETKTTEPKKAPRANVFTQQENVKNPASKTQHSQQTTRPITQKVQPVQQPKSYPPIESIVKNTASKAMVRVLVSFAIMTVVFGVGIALLVNNAVDEAVEIPEYNWDDPLGETEVFDDQSFDEQLAEIREYVDEKLAVSEDPVSSMSDYYRDQDSTGGVPFSTHFSSFNYSGSDACRLTNNSDYAIIILVNSAVLNYAVFLGSHSELSAFINLNPDDQLIFYAGKKYHETTDLTTYGPKGFRYVDQCTKDLLSKSWIVGSDEEITGGGDYFIELNQYDDKIRPGFSYKYSIQQKSSW